MRTVAGFIAFLTLLASPLSADEAKVSYAVDFELPNLQGESITLDTLIVDGPIIASFWATWCKPCMKEMPHLEEMQKKYSEMGLEVVAISIDDPKTRAKVVPTIKSRGFTFEVLLDTERSVYSEYHVSMVPYTLLIDQDKVIRYCRLGFKDGDEKVLEKKVRALLEIPEDHNE
jgi:peroxiredoxin